MFFTIATVFLLPLASTGSSFSISIAAETYEKYGCAYPMTYIFELEHTSATLPVVRRRNSVGDWNEVPYFNPDSPPNGKEGVRLEEEKRLYCSLAFPADSPTMSLAFFDLQGNPLQVRYTGLAPRYDNRSAAMVVSADDWDGFPKNHQGFLAAHRACAARGIWLTAGVTTQGVKGRYRLMEDDAAVWGDFAWPPVDWASIQECLDLGFLEVASHSRTHPGPCTFRPYRQDGSHTDPTSQVLIDSSTPFPEYLAQAGARLINWTDGSSCLVAAAEGNCLACQDSLEKGRRNLWTQGDIYYLDLYESEIEGSAQDITDHLRLPFSVNGNSYLYTWLEPCGYFDPEIGSQLGKSNYLVTRSMAFRKLETGLAEWSPTYACYTRDRPSYPLDSGNLEEANQAFEDTMKIGGVYHAVMHPRSIDWSPQGWVLQHLDHAANREGVWYVGLGHLYLYRFLCEPQRIRVEAR